MIFIQPAASSCHVCMRVGEWDWTFYIYDDSTLLSLLTDSLFTLVGLSWSRIAISGGSFEALMAARDEVLDGILQQ